MALRNLCVRGRSGKWRCKNIRPVTTLSAAKQYAYRLAQRLNLPPGSALSIRLSPKGRPDSGQLYTFRVRHGDIDCRVGFEFGKKC